MGNMSVLISRTGGPKCTRPLWMMGNQPCGKCRVWSLTRFRIVSLTCWGPLSVLGLYPKYCQIGAFAFLRHQIQFVASLAACPLHELLALLWNLTTPELRVWLSSALLHRLIGKKEKVLFKEQLIQFIIFDTINHLFDIRNKKKLW